MGEHKIPPSETVTLTLTDTQGTGLNVSSTEDVVFAPGTATRYVILDPTDGQIGTPIPVTVRALDQYGNIATGENRDVTLLTSGSATGGGLVNIVSGAGTRAINDLVPETVDLTLIDTQGTGLNVSSTQDVVFGPVGATRYVILDPTDGTVDAPILVTVEARDAFGNVVLAENRDVTLNTSGSAIGGGLVNIVESEAQKYKPEKMPVTGPGFGPGSWAMAAMKLKPGLRINLAPYYSLQSSSLSRSHYGRVLERTSIEDGSGTKHEAWVVETSGWYGLHSPKTLRFYLKEKPPYYLGTEIFNYDTNEAKRFVWLRSFERSR